MKKQKHSESQIVNAIKEHDAGKSAMDICRELGVLLVLLSNTKLKTPVEIFNGRFFNGYKKLKFFIFQIYYSLSEFQILKLQFLF